MQLFVSELNVNTQLRENKIRGLSIVGKNCFGPHYSREY